MLRRTTFRRAGGTGGMFESSLGKSFDKTDRAPDGRGFAPLKIKRRPGHKRYSAGWFTFTAYEFLRNLDPRLLVVAIAPSQTSFRTAMVDAWYGLYDFPCQVLQAQSAYGNMMRFIKSMKKGSKFDAEKFADQDINELRQMLETWMHMRGPFFHFDVRWFFYMYIVFFAYALYRWSNLEKMRSSKMDKGRDAELDYRWEKFSDDYEEDVRQQPSAKQGASK